MKLSLVVQTAGKMEGKVLNIPLPQFVIGRDPQCHLRPASPSISKRHCALIQRDGKVFVRDFDSTNGTFVNDVPVKGEAELHNEDSLKVGPLLFTVKVEGATAVNRPTPAPATKAPAQPPKQPVAAAKEPAAVEKKPQGRTALEDATADDDSVAAMLLSLQDDSAGSPLGSNDVPEGSTIMDIGVPPLNPDGTPVQEKKDDKSKPPPSTSNAAKALLEKYMRRPR